MHKVALCHSPAGSELVLEVMTPRAGELVCSGLSGLYRSIGELNILASRAKLCEL